MKKKYIAMLIAFSLLYCTAFADGTYKAAAYPYGQISYMEEAAGPWVLPVKTFTKYSNIYRPITYITMEDDGTVIGTETRTEHVATIAYRFYYSVNGDGEFVSGGVSSSNGNPVITAVNAAKFAVTVSDKGNPVWSASVYPDHSGISYSIKGGTFKLHCNHTIYVDPDGNFVAGVPSTVTLMYSYSTTYP